MEKPDFNKINLEPGATAQEMLTRMREWVDWVEENPEGDLTTLEVFQAMRGVILLGAAIVATIQGGNSVAMVLGMLAGEAIEGEIEVENERRAENARMN